MTLVSTSDGIDSLAGAPRVPGCGRGDRRALRRPRLQDLGKPAIAWDDRDYRTATAPWPTTLGFEGHMQWAEAMP